MNKITKVSITKYINGEYRVTFERHTNILSYWVVGHKVAQGGMLMQALTACTHASVHPYFCKYFTSITYCIPAKTTQIEEALGVIAAWLANNAPGADDSNVDDYEYWEDDGPSKQTVACHHTARKMARDLLKAAAVDTWGGCPLCRS